MACDRDALSDVAAGAVASADLTAHLTACEACRTELAALRRALAVADEEMTRLLAVEPSPELVARIRSALAESHSTRSWRTGWLWPALAAAAALVVTLAVVTRRPPSHEPAVAIAARPSPQPSNLAHPLASPPEPAREAAVADAAAGGTAPLLRPRPAARRWAHAEPEVLVPPGETEALLRLVALVHRERLTPPVLAAVGQPPADLAELQPIDIKPLEIVPLDPAESSGT
jgi:hypothetical protein